MKLNFKLRILCGTLALSLIMTACGSANTQGTQTGSVVEGTEQVSVEQENTQVVGNAAEGESSETVALTAEELEWQNCLMANVEESLNVRAEANPEAEVVGLLAKGDRATVLEVGEEWTKISSGNLEGYVSNEYCVYGTDALALAKEICETVATSKTDGLNIRQSASTDAEVIGQLSTDQKITVDTSAEVVDGWVAVIYNNKTAYVSAEFVSVGLNVGTGLTMEEIVEIERQRREEERKKQEEESDDDDSDYNGRWYDNYSDYEILAALIWCEARGESYECQVAVGAVVMNRVASSRFPGSIKSVIFQSGQFSPARDGKLKSAVINGKTYSSNYSAAEAAMGGQDPTGGCLFFKTNRGDQEGLIIGRMVFY